MEKIAERTKKIEVSGIREAFKLASKIKDPIDLSIGQPDFDVPALVKKEAIKNIKSGFNHYTMTTGIFKLRRKIAEKLVKRNSIKVSPDEIIVTSGTSGGIYLSYLTLLNPGDEIIIFEPYFVSYKELAVLVGAKPKFVSTFPDFQPKIDLLKKTISSKTKIIVLNSPNNPTGAVYPEKTIREIVKIAQENGIYILSDEVYEDFIFEGKHFSPGSIYNKIITLNGFSKSASMTGWRIGYAAGPKEIIDTMAKLQQFTYVCAPSFAQKAAIKAIDFDNSNKIKAYKIKRDIIYNGLKDQYDIVKTQGAFYAFVKIPKKEEEFIKKLIKHKVIVVPGSVFSQKPDYIRISFSNSKEKLRQAIKIFRDIISKEL